MLIRMPIALALTAAALTPALAQQAPEEGAVGPAEIRDFSLPGSRPKQPAEPEPTIAPLPQPRAEPRAEQTPAPAATATPAPAAQVPAEPIAERSTAPVARPASRRPAPEQTSPALSTSNLPAPEDVSRPLSPAPAPVPAPAPQAPVAQPAPEPVAPAVAAEPTGSFPWLWLALAGGTAALLFGLVRMRRRRTAGTGEELLLVDVAPAPPAPRPQAASPPRPKAAPVAPPVPAQAPQPKPASDIPGIVMRPWLEIEFRPERATATDTGAEVRYDVTIRNTGNAPARNVRLAASMFSAGPDLDREIAEFFGRGIDGAGAAPLTILPRSDVSFQSVVRLPRDQVKEIRIEGRSLFVPTVAFNLLYDWGRGKTGQTCSSHVVGREAETPSAKMGPFRLDLGPRVWRSVGQRPSALARAV